MWQRPLTLHCYCCLATGTTKLIQRREHGGVVVNANSYCVEVIMFGEKKWLGGAATESVVF